MVLPRRSLQKVVSVIFAASQSWRARHNKLYKENYRIKISYVQDESSPNFCRCNVVRV